MRKRTPLVGWLKRDFSRWRFPLPNSVWEYDLKPIEFVILSYLCYRSSHGRGGEAVTAEAVAHGVHSTVTTAKKYLSSLVSKTLVVDEPSLAPTSPCAGSKQFFTLPNEIFLLNLPPSAFVVYAYLLLIEDRKTHTCHPSYSTIAIATGMARNTVIKSVGLLLDAVRRRARQRQDEFDRRRTKATLSPSLTPGPEAAV